MKYLLIIFSFVVLALTGTAYAQLPLTFSGHATGSGGGGGTTPQQILPLGFL